MRFDALSIDINTEHEAVTVLQKSREISDSATDFEHTLAKKAFYELVLPEKIIFGFGHNLLIGNRKLGIDVHAAPLIFPLLFHA
jgi:hypothetical protein